MRRRSRYRSATFAAANGRVKATSLNESPARATKGIISTAGNGGKDTYQRPRSNTQSFRFGGRAVRCSLPCKNASACQTKCGACDCLASRLPLERPEANNEKPEESRAARCSLAQERQPARVTPS